MGFYEGNKEFIKQKLQTSFENLDANLRAQKYLKIKDEVRQRITASYKGINKANTERGQILNKYFFYKDLITYVGQYESSYILLNLFLEPYFHKVLFIFEKEDELSSFLAVRSRIKPSYLIIYLKYFVKTAKFKNKEDIYINRLEIQIKKYFQSCLSAKEELWSSKNYYISESFNKSYPSFVLSEISKSEINWRLIVFNHLLFIKAWNNFEYFKIKSNTKRALILDEFKHHFVDDNSPIKEALKLFEEKIYLLHNSIFVDDVKSPFSLLDEEKLIPKSSGLINTIPHFVHKNKVFINNILEKNYLELIQFIEQNKDDEQIKFFVFSGLIKDLEKKDEDLINAINIKIKELNKVKSILKFWSIRDELTCLKHAVTANRSELSITINGIKKARWAPDDTALALLKNCLDIKIKLNQHISKEELTSIICNNSHSVFILKSKRLVFKKFYLFEYL